MRQDQWADTLTIDGVPLGVWDQVTGGASEATETKYRPGGLARQITLGGATSIENVTLRKLLNQETGDWDTLRNLYERNGKADAILSRQPLDRDGNPFGRPLVYTGKLQRVVAPPNNSEDTGAALWEVVISTDGNVG